MLLKFLFKYFSKTRIETIRPELEKSEFKTKTLDNEISLDELDLSSFLKRSSICSDDIMMKHFNLSNP